MKVDIIISRFNENISWTSLLKNAIIYNKGEPLNITNEIMMKNVGREGHTYYKHIYDNYENLPDYTMFLQADPFDHYANVMEKIEYFMESEDLNIDFELITDKVIIQNIMYDNYDERLPLKRVFKYLYGDIDPTEVFVEFGPGALFIVSKQAILSNSRDFYKKIVDILGKENCPVEGYSIERFHKMIFTKNL
jgi:hypothetical protein